jgi:hypothetical protein
MPDLNVRATLAEVMGQEPARVLRAVVLVLLAEINVVRAALVPSLPPLTAADVLAKVKANL